MGHVVGGGAVDFMSLDLRPFLYIVCWCFPLLIHRSVWWALCGFPAVRSILWLLSWRWIASMPISSRFKQNSLVSIPWLTW